MWQMLRLARFVEATKGFETRVKRKTWVSAFK